ncbi:radical SAM protein, partial [Methermicoccus shengliensis]|nr:radical SAM protein [Methermicoccus shengliensis]
KCTFCSSSTLFGSRWRGHSPERVLEEVKLLHDEYGVGDVEVLDDTFTLSKKRATMICELLSSELDIAWACSSRVDTIDHEMLAKMRGAGVHTIFYGIESGSDETLKRVGKGITTAKAETAVRATRNEGIALLGSFMIGFPFERAEDIRKTLEFSQHVGVEYAQFSIATPYPGSMLWEVANTEGVLLTRDWRRYTALEPIMRLKYLSPEDVKRWLYRAWVGFYLRPRYIVRDMVKRRGMLLRTALRKLPILLRLNRGRVM